LFYIYWIINCIIYGGWFNKMKKVLNIRSLHEYEIGIASSLIPPEWNFNLEKFQHLHLSEGIYKAFGGFINEHLICFGDVIINGKSGWLRNIVVNPEFRTKGFGQEITMFLTNYLKNRQCRTILTMATELSKVHYQKLGFLTDSMYCYLKGKLLSAPPLLDQIRPIEVKDLYQINALDVRATGEDRSKLFNNSATKGKVYFSGARQEIQGFFLPESGEGPIIASSVSAGLALLQLKHSLSLQDAVIPCENKNAVDYLKKKYFRETGMVYRMILGEDIDWKPEMMFSRAARYSA
jgi:GNAT superfamily N-acetyltransferase